MSEPSNTPSVPSTDERLSFALTHADSIARLIDSPWVWARLGPNKLGRAQDALDDLRCALTVPNEEAA